MYPNKTIKKKTIFESLAAPLYDSIWENKVIDGFKKRNKVTNLQPIWLCEYPV